MEIATGSIRSFAQSALAWPDTGQRMPMVFIGHGATLYAPRLQRHDEQVTYPVSDKAYGSSTMRSLLKH